jgi:hypothetical protein
VPEIQIQDVRFSFIWVETAPDLLADPVPSDAPLAFLRRRWTYAQEFDRVIQGGAGSVGLALPWPVRAGRQFFWAYYLEKPIPGDLTGDQAWNALVPFRGKVPAKAQAPWPPEQLFLEAFFYPHGLAFVLTARCCDQLTLQQVVEKAFEMRRTGKFQVKWDNGGVETLSLDMFADKALAALRQVAFGPAAPPGAGPLKPFTIVTVVKGTGVDPAVPTPDGGEIHRALEAMTSWRPTWMYDKLTEIAAASLRIRTAPPSHVLYGRARGRAVWFPALFIPGAEAFHSLACYHRNLVFASLQVESLGNLASETAKQLRQGMSLSAAHRECAQQAAGILGRLYAGASSYRSWSPRAQIEQNDLVADVNEVRDFFNMGPLA